MKKKLSLVLAGAMLLASLTGCGGGSAQTATTAAARAALQEKQQLIDVMKYSLIIISSIPVLVMYPLVQKHFVKGVMIGSMKG